MKNQTLFIGSISIEDMKREANQMISKGAAPEEVERRLDEMADRNNRFSWAVEHPEDTRVALAVVRQ